MTLTLKSLGVALITTGLMSTAQATLVSLSAVVDFDGVNGNTRPPRAFSDGDVITNQYAHFGLLFTDTNVVRCSMTTNPPPNPACHAPRAIAPPQSGPNFLMNDPPGTGFSIRVLDGFFLSTMKLDIARNNSAFFIKLYDANDQFLSSPIDAQTGSNFSWAADVVLAGITSAVRRIEFSGSVGSSFAIDFLRFDYVTNSTNVPEPAVLGLVALALAGAGLSRRRKG